MKNMRIYRFISLAALCSCFLIFISFSFYKNLVDLPAGTDNSIINPEQDYQAPFNLVYHFYRALGEGDWEQIRKLSTPVWWAEMHRSGFYQKWDILVKNDSSINFVMFLVAEQKIDLKNNLAWVKGKVDWSSSQQKIADENVTVFFVKEANIWRINSIRNNLPVDLVDDFYQSINEGKFRKISVYTTKNYWNTLTQSGIIDSLKTDWRINKTGVYCVFHLDDFRIQGNEAWVKGDVNWNPLTKKEKETPVTIFLINSNGWRIRKIVGHWEINK